MWTLFFLHLPYLPYEDYPFFRFLLELLDDVIPTLQRLSSLQWLPLVLNAVASCRGECHFVKCFQYFLTLSCSTAKKLVLSSAVSSTSWHYHALPEKRSWYVLQYYPRWVHRDPGKKQKGSFWSSIIIKMKNNHQLEQKHKIITCVEQAFNGQFLHGRMQ